MGIETKQKPVATSTIRSEMDSGIMGTSVQVRYNLRADQQGESTICKGSDNRASTPLDYPKRGEAKKSRKYTRRNDRKPATNKKPLDQFVLTELCKVVTSFFNLAQSDPLPSLKEVTDEFKKALVLRTMELCNGNCHEAARYLRMNRTTLSNIFGDVNPYHKRIMRPGIVVCVNSMTDIPDYVYDEIKKLLMNFGY